MLHLLLSKSLVVFCCADYVGVGEGLGIFQLEGMAGELMYIGRELVGVLLLPIGTERRQSDYQVSTKSVECFGGVDGWRIEQILFNGGNVYVTY